MFYADKTYLLKLASELEEQKLADSAIVRDAGPTEVESLAFDLSTIAQLATIFVASVEAAKLAKVLYYNLPRDADRDQKIEYISPIGRDYIDLTGKTEAEIETDLRKKFPFMI